MKLRPVTSFLGKDGALNIKFQELTDVSVLEGWADVAAEVRSLDL